MGRQPLIVALALAAGFAGTAHAQSDPGEQQFNMRCKACHVVSAGGASGPLAPNLRGVVGRKAGSGTFNAYSPTIKSSKIVWNAASLDKFLTAPGKLIPGTKMVMAVPDAGQRKAIVSYLAKQK